LGCILRLEVDPLIDIMDIIDTSRVRQAESGESEREIERERQRERERVRKNDEAF